MSEERRNEVREQLLARLSQDYYRSFQQALRESAEVNVNEQLLVGDDTDR